MTEKISKFASLTLRTICLAYKDIPIPDESELYLLFMFVCLFVCLLFVSLFQLRPTL